MKNYFIEVTDTFGGEANYCWVKRYKVAASSARGAISKLARIEGGAFRYDYGYECDYIRYNGKGCYCAFLEQYEPENHDHHSNIIEL